MERVLFTARPDWQNKVEQWGLTFHSESGLPYWDEAIYYQFTAIEIDALENATNELERLCNEAVQHIIDADRFAEFGITQPISELIKWAWEAEPPSLFGRFDLAYDGSGPPKMLEYNADTPTSLLEAAVIQWKWLQECFPDSDQFNSIWEHLVAQWKWLSDNRKLRGSLIHFAHTDTAEEEMTVVMLRDTAQEAGLVTDQLLMERIGWDNYKGYFTDLQDRRIWSIFKLYPWEWLVKESFSANLIKTYRDTQWIEPIWKMLLSNKALLPILWEMFPGHENLLPAYLDSPRELADFVKKPLLGREGANVTISAHGQTVETDGPFADGGFVYQALAPVTTFDGKTPIIGSWIVGGEACGMGIRESDGLITDNLSRFVPHRFL